MKQKKKTFNIIVKMVKKMFEHHCAVIFETVCLWLSTWDIGWQSLLKEEENVQHNNL